MSTLCTPASTEHLFRVKVCLRVSLSQQQQGHKMGLPRLLLMCGNSHGGTQYSHLSHKIALVKLYEDKMNWPRFPKLFFSFLFELSFTKSTQKKSKKYSPSSFPPDPPFLPPPPLLWLNYPGNKKGMLDWRETSYSHPYHKVQREFYDVSTPSYLWNVQCSAY